MNAINEPRKPLRNFTLIAVAGLPAQWHRPSIFAAQSGYAKQALAAAAKP